MISASSNKWQTVTVFFDDEDVIFAQDNVRIIIDQGQWQKIIAAQQERAADGFSLLADDANQGDGTGLAGSRDW